MPGHAPPHYLATNETPDSVSSPCAKDPTLPDSVRRCKGLHLTRTQPQNALCYGLSWVACHTISLWCIRNIERRKTRSGTRQTGTQRKPETQPNARHPDHPDRTQHGVGGARLLLSLRILSAPHNMRCCLTRPNYNDSNTKGLRIERMYLGVSET